MYRANVRPLALIALLGAVACAEKVLSLSEGDPSSLAVTVYVDADGNGQYDAGMDLAVVGATVTATSDAGDETATAGADGIALFASLAPGSYQLSVAVTPPSGAVLASAASPAVVAPFQGATLTSEFRYSFFPGGITGVVYSDEDSNGTYDAGTDIPAPGVELTLVAAGTDTLNTVVTDATGAFALNGLRPGDYTIEITPFAGLTFVNGTSQPVTVGAAAQTAFDIEFTGSVAATPIAAARGMDGQVVTVEGIITWQKQWDNRGYYLQDETGGFAVFDASGPTLARGDSVRLRGTVGSFDGEIQLGSIVSLSVVAQVNEPTPRSVTAGEMNAGQFQGELGRIAGTVDSVQDAGFGSQLVFLTSPAGQDFTAFGDNRTGMALGDWTVSSEVVVVGLLATDDDDTFIYRVEPRDISDLTVLDPPTAVSAVRALALGDTAAVEGVVTWQYSWDTRVYYVQDVTGGIGTFDGNRPDLQRGDRVRIRGVRGAFDGEEQLSPILSIAVVGQDAVPTPRVVTAAEVNGGQVMGELVSLTGLVDSVLDPGFGSQLAYLTDGAAQTVTAFGDNRMGLTLGDWTVGTTVTVVGVVAGDDDFTFQNRIELRDPNDLNAGPAPADIATARGLALGDTVAVEGVVTGQYTWDSRVYFLQDATGGIGTFDTGSPSLQRGDRIRVRGVRGAFDGEEQLSPILSLAVLGQEAVPTPRVVSATDVNSGLVLGQLVSLTGLVDSVLDPGFGSQLVYMTDGGGQTVTAFGDNRMGLTLGDWTVGVTATVVGIVAGDDDFTFQNRIELRDPNDKQ